MEAETTEEILAEYEELFAKRYTEDDAEYVKAIKTASPPPCIPDWLNAGRGYQGRDDRRDRYSQGQGQGRYGERYHPYERNDRPAGGRYGDRHGDRYGNRPSDRYDDRSRHDNRKKTATEYGSQGYFQYYY
ncbi:hypothetical protein QZH41_011650 [Actinostola sp. cb2023]|nr:hypothetical protein QZH41_011650 [Actinostola sp. cb2023]